MFKASKEGIEDTSYNFLMMPYLGKAKVQSVKLEEVNNTENCFVETFILEEEDIKGQNVNGVTHQNLEWAYDPEGDDEKEQKKMDRVAYFASKFVPEEDVLAVEASTWREYCTKIIQLLENANYQNVELQLKVIGNVYNGKARVQCPKYPGWISTDGKALTFSKSEMRQNQQYLDAISAQPSDPESAVAVDAIDEAGF